tara:strand:+ start:305 stop:814 length:510 start_codon:yes stop_codon:yes gene_type:complete
MKTHIVPNYKEALELYKQITICECDKPVFKYMNASINEFICKCNASLELGDKKKCNYKVVIQYPQPKYTPPPIKKTEVEKIIDIKLNNYFNCKITKEELIFETIKCNICRALYSPLDNNNAINILNNYAIKYLNISPIKYNSYSQPIETKENFCNRILKVAKNKLMKDV